MTKKSGYHDSLRQQLGALIDQLQLPTLYRRSLQRRWLDQVIWADKKAAECRRWHYRLRLTTIIGGVVLPALVGINFQFAESNPTLRLWFPYIPFFLSQVIAVSAAIEEFCRFGDRWRDYRKMAEDLKAEGWQYLQLSGVYQDQPNSITDDLRQDGVEVIVKRTQKSPRPPRWEERHDSSKSGHLQHYATFASRVESIIKNDVQNYISELVKQQAKQEQEIENYLEIAQTTTTDKTLFAQPTMDDRTPDALPPVAAPPPGNSPPGNVPPGTGMTPPGWQPPMGTAPLPMGASAPPGHLPMPMMGSVAGLPPGIMTPPPPPTWTAPPPIPTPPAPAPVPSASPSQVDMNAAIVAATNSLRGMSTAAGPDGGNNACAWTVNKVLQQAGIAPLGDNPDYVPAVLDALKQGRGRQVPRQAAKAGDLVIAYGEAHIGIGLDQGCTRVLSNSSSRAAFVWESDTDFDGYYGGASTIYRLT